MSLLAPTFLFRFAVPCYRLDSLWSKQEIQLPELYRMPTFGELEERPMYADLRVGWNEEGIGVSVRVVGKRQTPWCRRTRMEDSDGLRLWFDTRNTGNIHRASRFCHEFMIMPQGGGNSEKEPFAALIEIHRSKENPRPVSPEAIQIRNEKRVDGYRLRAAIPAEALTGFEPSEHHQLGFSYAVMDRELGWQTFTISNEFPFMSDPSLWGTLDLINDTPS